MPVNNNGTLEKRLWDAADELRANSSLKASEYSVPVLGLIFLRFADVKFAQAEKTLKKKKSSRRKVGKVDYQAKGIMYLPDEARFANLLKLPEGEDIGKAINEAMKLIEQENKDLAGVLPRTYHKLENATLIELLKTMSSIPDDIEGDAFGKIYEYFLGKFAMTEGQKGGEFFTPTCIVRLMVEIMEPFKGKIFDPSAGSGGMFVQSARFVENHKNGNNNTLSIYGQERVGETVRLCKMNLAVHGLSGDVKEANSYYEDLHKSAGAFDYVMANPPFNVNKIDKDKIKDDKKRYPLGMPSVDNGNYIWIQMFYGALNKKGRAGFVMANSAADARASELTLRKKLIKAGAVDVMVAVGPNFFYTVTLPCMLWFLDKGKTGKRKDTVLFIDARNVFTQVDRAHREFAPEQIEFLANIVRLYRGESLEKAEGSAKILKEHFPKGKYLDVPGLCKVATLEEIKAQGWSLNPGRYVGVGEQAEDDFDFKERLTDLNDELEGLNKEAGKLEKRIAKNIQQIMKGA